jgi:uncharacterized membrane protein YccF (DUF307 family)
VRLLLNILWFIFGGWISGTLWVIAAAVLAVTLVGLPWSPAAFRMGCFSYAPFGHVVVERQARAMSLILNLLWFVLAGWWLALHHLILAVALAVTIIGIPFAWQHVRLAAISLAPVGKQIVEA